MLLSHDDATERWCPYGRAMVTARDDHTGKITALAAVNRGGKDPEKGTNCIGNVCMVWRWGGWPTEFGTYAQAPAAENRTGPRLGYCGLAGKPFGVP